MSYLEVGSYFDADVSYFDAVVSYLDVSYLEVDVSYLDADVSYFDGEVSYLELVRDSYLELPNASDPVPYLEADSVLYLEVEVRPPSVEYDWPDLRL